MKNIFIEYPKCSTCKKAKKWLEENNIEFIDRNIVEEIPTVKELEEWINCSEQNINIFKESCEEKVTKRMFAFLKKICYDRKKDARAGGFV